MDVQSYEEASGVFGMQVPGAWAETQGVVEKILKQNEVLREDRHEILGIIKRASKQYDHGKSVEKMKKIKETAIKNRSSIVIYSGS